MPGAEEWLDNEEHRCRDDRLERLKWIMQKYPKIDGQMFYGGIKSYYLFEEARYCFVYGQYIASTMLSLSYIENTLGSIFYAGRRNDLERASLADLLKQANKERLISDQEFIVFDKVRKIRNPLTHFRKPNKEDLELQSFARGMNTYEMLEEDAKVALTASFRIMEKFYIARSW